MNKVKLHTLWLLGMLFLMTACGDDDDYYYPSVKLEFVTVKAGADGLIQSLLPDKGELLTVAKDRTGSTISPNSAGGCYGCHIFIAVGGDTGAKGG